MAYTYDRSLSLFVWVFWAVIAALALAECCVRGVNFHIIIFSAYISCYLMGAVAALRHNIYVENRILQVCLVFGVVNILATAAVLTSRLSLDIIARTLIIMVMQTTWIVCRMAHLKRIRAGALLLQNGGFYGS